VPHTKMYGRKMSNGGKFQPHRRLSLGKVGGKIRSMQKGKF
jgi:hypothetical protein